MTAVPASAQVCIIGAGSSGITTAQVLASRGVSFDCFEAGSEVGGNWRYENDNEMSSAYASLHINTSRQLMEYAAYPMPEDLPDYPDHRQIARYFDDFVDHFGLRERITFRTEVTLVEPLEPPPVERASVGEPSRRTPLRRHRPLTRRRRAGDPPVPGRDRGQRPPLGPPLAGAVLPGRGRVPRRAAARALLPDTGAPGRQAGAGARHRQLGLRHRGGVHPGGRVDRPRDASRGAHPAQVHVRRTDRPPHRLAPRPRPAEAAAVVAGGPAAPDPGQGDRLRAPRAGPRRAARAPDGQPGPAQPSRPRRHQGPARTSTASRGRRSSSPTAPRGSTTWSSTAPGTG